MKTKQKLTVFAFLILMITVACSANSPPQPTLAPVAQLPGTENQEAIQPTATKPAPTATAGPQYEISDNEFLDIVEQVYTEWDRILEVDLNTSEQFFNDYEYYLDAEYCNGDLDCEFDALELAFDTKSNYLDSLQTIQEDMYSTNQVLNEINRSDVSPKMLPVLIEMQNAASNYENYFTYTFIAFSQEPGSAAQERGFDQAFAAYEEAYEHYELAWNILTGSASQAEIDEVESQPETIEYIGNGNRVREFTVSGSVGLRVDGRHHGDSNFIGEIFDSDGQLEAIVFNCIGGCSDSSIIQLGPGTHFLEITADGDWEATITLLDN